MAFEGIWRNGKTLVDLRIDLSRVSVQQVRELNEKSWRCNAGRPPATEKRSK